MEILVKALSGYFLRLINAAIGDIIWSMDEVQELIAELRGRGWTVAALARELEVDYRSIIRWQNGQRTPANVAGVRSILRGLLKRRRIPKRRTYKRNPPTT
jgi:hypothetical protein